MYSDNLADFRIAQGFTVWLTGLSGAGKSTVAQALRAHLLRNGLPPPAHL